MSRDATFTKRGFSYQRQYAILLFLQNINNNNITKIIEEGKINNKTYEDITLININNELITYQIKFNKSYDVFKTIGNENNFDSNVKEINYVISKNNNFDEKFLKLININNDSIILRDMIFLLNTKKNNKINDINNSNKKNPYKTCMNLLKNKTPNEILIYLSKYNFFCNYNYSDLIDKINDSIKNIFKVDNYKIIYLIKYLIFDLFEKNEFTQNIEITINIEYNKIKNYINENANINNNNDKFLLLLKKEIQNNKNNLDNIFIELNNYYDNNKNISFNDYLKIINIYHTIYKLNNYLHKETIKTRYKTICIDLCIKLMKSSVNNTTLNMDKVKICSSISYYYKHNINSNVNLKKSYIFDKLCENDKNDIIDFFKC